MIILIAAIAENNALGKNNDLLWHLPDDFKHFKETTSGHYIIMGRKTFESFPKPLPNRTHIIITRQKNYFYEGCIVVADLETALSFCPKNDDIYVIGGGEIYSQSIEFADQLEITLVHHSFEADVFFPEINPEKWQLVSELYHPQDEKHSYDFSFQTYIRKNKNLVSKI
jgi:dihydrofolate reductase